MKIKHWIGALTVSLFATLYGEPTGAPTALEQGTFTRGMPREVTPAAGPRVAHGANAFLTADFIYWKATQAGLEYGMSNVLIGTGSTITSRGSTRTPDFGWDPGFKVGLGINLPYDGWDTYVQYTWLQSNGNHSRMRNSDGNIIPKPWAGSPDGGASRIGDITEARTRWDFHFHVLDLELGRSYYLSRFLTLRPFAGLKWTWQSQDWVNRYNGNNVRVDNSPSNVPGTARVSQDHDFWGVGIRTGLNTNWYIAEHWSIFANGALATVWADYDVSRTDIFQPNTQAAGSNIVRTRQD
ncbi:MAG: hypothetical protein KDK76_07245, partial [Chlamydiia bacterium]|nr:hypothetical protein [Chlamydiia bacterium]